MTKVYLGMIIVLAATSLCLGQSAKGKKTAPLADDGQSNRRVVLMSGTSIDAQLEKTVDVNNAKVGDQVMLRTSRSVRQDGSVLIPKGSTLIGRVTEVQRRTKENSQSRIAMIFDRIEGRDLSMPISASIVSITGVAASTAVGDTFASDVTGSSQTSSSVSRSSSGGSGGLLGGVGSTVGGLVNTTAQTVGSTVGTVNQTTTATTGAVGRTLSGLQISSSASGKAGSTTTLSSTSKNLRIEKGATFNLRVDGRGAVQE
jgi:hypothetical protein